jgi:hypothetical protein
MLHHISFNARDPERTATVISQMLNASLLRAPTPPFPAGSWFVCLGDDHGTLLEVVPWGEVRDPDSRGMTLDSDMRPLTGSHVLLSAAVQPDRVLALAHEAGWRAEPGSAGLFEFIKIWIENAYLIELMTPSQAAMYKATFSSAGLNTLDAKLRAIETALTRSK